MLAVGVTRGWRSTLIGVAAAAASLVLRHERAARTAREPTGAMA